MIRRINYLLLLPLVVLINYLSVRFAIFLNIPFFMDTWGTSLGVMLGGLSIGLAGGIAYNLLMMTEWGPGAWVWSFASIWVALVTNFLFKKGWIDIRKPGKLFISGLFLGISSAVVNIIILFVAWGGVETYGGVLPTYDAFIELTGSSVISAVLEKFITIPIDQIVAIFIAAIAFTMVPRSMVLTRMGRRLRKRS